MEKISIKMYPLRTAISLYANVKPLVTNPDLIGYTLQQPANGTIIHLLGE